MSAAHTIIAGRYAVFGEIASGGMARVRLGRLFGAGGFSRTVAIKQLHDAYARDPEFLGMLLDEARVMARIHHPNVVQMLDVVSDAGALFVVMEYVHGESLARLLRTARASNAPVPLRIAAGIVVNLLQGLHAAHEARSETGEPLHVVHRDVSPQNVHVGVDGVARVLDFGVAKAALRVQVTQRDEVKGKIAYIAPEQIRGELVDRRADVYAASVVLWEMLTGQRLFEAGSQAELVINVLGSPAPTPASRAAGVPPAVDAIVMRGLSHDLDARFGTAAAMAAELERTVPPAPPVEIAAWMRSVATASLNQRAAQLVEIESMSGRDAVVRARQAIAELRSLPAEALPSGAPIGPTTGDRIAMSTSSSSAQRLDLRIDPRNPPSGSFPPSVAPQVADLPTGALRPTRSPFVAAGALGFAGLVALGLFLGVVGAGRKDVRDALHRVTGKRGTSELASNTGTANASAPGRPTVVDPLGSTNGLTAPVAAGAGLLGPSPNDPCPAGMLRIPGGKFFMGSDDDLDLEKPAHQVTLMPYCIDELEVTTAQYKACSDRGECKRAGTNNRWASITDSDRAAYDSLCNSRDPERRGQHPINCVDWSMASRYCAAAGRRLPTEAEWEFAARGPDGRKYPWGDEAPGPTLLNACGRECVSWGGRHALSLDAMFTGDDGWPATAPVGSFPAGKSRYGVQDVVGNVWEWVADRFGAYSADDQVNPHGPASGEERVMRGGAWNGAYAAWVRPTFRWHDAEDTRSHGIGFRCAQ